MNTKTMRLPPRRLLTPTKRKERDGFNSVNKPSITTQTKTLKPTTSTESEKPASSNQLLAGYLAHEYLTKGTLFCEQIDSTAKAEAEAEMETEEEEEEVVTTTTVGEGSKKEKPSQKAEPEYEPTMKNERYVVISNLLKNDGAHISGIVNPTHLGQFLSM